MVFQPHEVGQVEGQEGLHPSMSVGVKDPCFQLLGHPANLSGAVTNGAG